jgi:hypothetical protein
MAMTTEFGSDNPASLRSRLSRVFFGQDSGHFRPAQAIDPATGFAVYAAQASGNTHGLARARTEQVQADLRLGRKKRALRFLPADEFAPKLIYLLNFTAQHIEAVIASAH